MNISLCFCICLLMYMPLNLCFITTHTLISPLESPQNHPTNRMIIQSIYIISLLYSLWLLFILHILNITLPLLCSHDSVSHDSVSLPLVSTCYISRFVIRRLLPPKLIREWKTLFLNGQPLFEVQEKEVEVQEMPSNVELERQQLLNETELVDYRVSIILVR